MSSPESSPSAPDPRRAELPPDLAAFLATCDLACLTHPTDRGTALVVKAPTTEISSVMGPVPIRVRHELYEAPTAPVIRVITTVYDRTDQPLALETFLNVQDPDQRADYEALAQQDELFLLFYDEHLHHRLTKRVAGVDHAHVAAVLARALAYAQLLPEGQYSFEIAKALVMEQTGL